MQDFIQLGSKTVIYTGGNYGTYVVQSDFCSCPAGSNGKKCKHLKMVKDMVIPFETIPTTTTHYPSSVKGLNDLYKNGPYSDDGVLVFYGKASMGKTLLTLQDIENLAAKFDVKTLYIDTEGGSKSMIEAWHPVFKDRFKTPDNSCFFESKKTIETLCEYFGFKISLEWKQSNASKKAAAEEAEVEVEEEKEEASEGKKKKKAKKVGKGTMEFKLIATLEEPQVDKDIEDNRINILVLDSLSTPIRERIPDVQQNAPAKSSVQALILGKLAQLQEKYKIAAIVLVHASYNPADVYSLFAEMRGGIGLHHAAKRVVYVDKREAYDQRNFRQFWLVRGESSPAFSRVGVAEITNYGYQDSTRPIEELVTDGQKKWLADVKTYLEADAENARHQ